MKQNFKKLMFLLFTLSAILMFGLSANADTGVFKLSFFNNNAATQYDNLTITGEKGDVVTLPKAPAMTGYTFKGWTKVEGGVTVTDKAGSKITIWQNQPYYAIYAKNTYSVTLKYTSGKVYRTITRYYGSTFTLPKINKTGYKLYWYDNTNTLYSAGSTYRVTKNAILYPYFKATTTSQAQKTYTLSLYTCGGTLIKSYTVNAGDSFALPGTKNTSAFKSHIGWSYKAWTVKNPDYPIGTSITVNSNIKLYATVFDSRYETLHSTLTCASTKYDYIFFVGDSRTYRMNQALINVGADLTNIEFICLSGSNLNWLKSKGFPTLLRSLKNVGKSKKVAIVFNHGANDLANVDNYIPYMNKIANVLKASYNCDLYYESVNPLSKAQISTFSASAAATRTEFLLQPFNKKIYSSLCSGGQYTYINTYSYLNRIGFAWGRALAGLDPGINDGIHYTPATSINIFNYVMRILS